MFYLKRNGGFYYFFVWSWGRPFFDAACLKSNVIMQVRRGMKQSCMFVVNIDLMHKVCCFAINLNIKLFNIRESNYWNNHAKYTRHAKCNSAVTN